MHGIPGLLYIPQSSNYTIWDHQILLCTTSIVLTYVIFISWNYKIWRWTVTIFEKFLLSSCMTRGCFIPMKIFVSSYFGFVTGVSLLFFKRKGSGSLSCFFLKPQIAVIERNFGHPFHGIPINFFQIHM